MKKLKQKIIIVCLLSVPIMANAQFNIIGTIGRTQNLAPNITGVGIGFFPTVPSLNARLHVNNFLLGAPAGLLNGFLFRTDGNSAVVNQWQLFTGATNLTTTEKFKLFVPANDSCVVVKSTTAELFLANNKTQISVTELKAMQEQNKTMDSLKTKLNKVDSLENILNQLAQQINSCCSSSSIGNNTIPEENNSKIPSYNVNIGNDDLPMLAQNIPNPHGNTTNIQFNIPKNCANAQIVFFNEQGMILNSVEINTKGRGQLNVNAEMLENGLYFYSLIIDGKKVDTKKMVKAE
jgi:hypothetical protein